MLIIKTDNTIIFVKKSLIKILKEIIEIPVHLKCNFFVLFGGLIIFFNKLIEGILE